MTTLYIIARSLCPTCKGVGEYGNSCYGCNNTHYVDALVPLADQGLPTPKQWEGAVTMLQTLHRRVLALEERSCQPAMRDDDVTLDLAPDTTLFDTFPGR